MAVDASLQMQQQQPAGCDPERPSGCLCAHRGTAPAFIVDVAGLNLGHAVVISEIEKKEPMHLKEKHLLACEALLAFRLQGLRLIRLRAG